MTCFVACYWAKRGRAVKRLRTRQFRHNPPNTSAQCILLVNSVIGSDLPCIGLVKSSLCLVFEVRDSSFVKRRSELLLAKMFEFLEASTFSNLPMLPPALFQALSEEFCPTKRVYQHSSADGV
jgi:hypothetical protein